MIGSIWVSSISVMSISSISSVSIRKSVSGIAESGISSITIVEVSWIGISFGFALAKMVSIWISSISMGGIGYWSTSIGMVICVGSWGSSYDWGSSYNWGNCLNFDCCRFYFDGFYS
jgi:hypothetical protein